MAAWYCACAMSQKFFSRTTSRTASRTGFTSNAHFLRLSALAFGLLVGCTSGVEADSTRSNDDAGADSANTKPDTQQDVDASVQGTSSNATGNSGNGTSTSKPTTSATNTTSTGSNQTSTTSPGSTSTGTSSSATTLADASVPTSAPASTDADTSEPTTSEPSEPSPEGHDVFVVLGHGQRTMVSCDDGKTWTHNQFTDDLPLTGVDLDHQPYNMRAAAYDAGTFYAAWGWGSPTYVERSVDGVNWEGVLNDPDRTSGRLEAWGMIAGDGKVLVGENTTYALSEDGGDTWQTVSSGLNSAKPVFGYGNGVFVAVTEGGTNRDYQGYPTFLRSTDGRTWSSNVDFPENCVGGRATKIAYGKGTFVVAVEDHICSSKDGGQSWQRRPSPGGAMFQAVFDGKRFLALNQNNVLYASPDGLDWSELGSFQGSRDWNMGFGVSTTTGTVIAVRQNKIFRSDDGGVSFKQLDAGAYVDEGGPLVQVEFGRVASSPACK